MYFPVILFITESLILSSRLQARALACSSSKFDADQESITPQSVNKLEKTLADNDDIGNNNNDNNNCDNNNDDNNNNSNNDSYYCDKSDDGADNNDNNDSYDNNDNSDSNNDDDNDVGPFSE